MSARPGCLGVSRRGGLKGLTPLLAILCSLVLSLASEDQHTRVSISVSRVTIYQGGITSRQNELHSQAAANRAPDGSPERRGPDPGAWSREDVTGGSPLGTLSHGPASHNNFTKFNILQPNLISDYLPISIQDTTTTTKTPTIKFKTRPRSSSKSENFEKNQSVAERNYRLLRQKHNKKARSTTSKTTKVTTPTTTKYVPTTTTEQTTIRATTSIRPDSRSPSEAISESSDNNKTGIKSMVDSEILQLKSDLDQLLQFNENLLHFDSSIVKNAAKNKVEKFMEKLSATIENQLGEDDTEQSDEKFQTASNILSVTEDIGRTLASTLEPGTETEIRLANISMIVMKRRRRRSTELEEEDTVTTWDTGTGVRVELPATPGAGDTVSLSMASYNNLGPLMSGGARGQVTRSSVLAVSILEAGLPASGWTELARPVTFSLRHAPLLEEARRRCSYWHFPASEWREDGCEALEGGSSLVKTVCQCHHLTNFAITEQVDNVVDTIPPQSTTITTTSATKSTAMQSWTPVQYFSARPALVTRRTSRAPSSPSSFSSRRFRSFRTLTKSDITGASGASVTVVSAPPRVKEARELDAVTTTTATTTTTTEPSDAKQTWRAVSTAPDLWSVSAPPKVTTHNSSVLKSDTKDKDKRNSPEEDYPPSSDTEIEWVFFEYFEGPIPSEKSQPLKILTFEAHNDTGTGTMDQYFEDAADVSLLTLSVSIILCALCLVIGLVSALICSKRRSKILPISSSSPVHHHKITRDHSFGSVSSTQSVLTDPEFHDISSSFETICADHFLTSLEDE